MSSSDCQWRKYLTCKRCSCFIYLNGKLVLISALIEFLQFFFISFVYKLTDFGAARELEAHEVFMSVYGTEEYLVCQALIRFVYK